MAEHQDDPELVAWAARQPPALTGDPIWRLAAYRHAAYVLELARRDAVVVARDPVAVHVASQLLRAGSSIAANLAEGYGRPTIPDRLRFISIALGSLRETIAWYRACSSSLPADVANARIERLSRLRRITLGLLVRLRGRSHPRVQSW